ncbi:MAG TPA: S41 family peptidase [Bacteroidales bacterium]|nr:S41 family peptidase [Bacteroidales bacterium]HOR60598.1 S41 family peptidase [Bacteroidales bacterium]HPL04821.1 S41 family peptidase [Bacteroidales bacterium]
MKYALLIITFIVSINCQAQIEKREFNFGFEKQSSDKELSDGWFQWGDFLLSIESVGRTGNKSGKITSNEKAKFGCIAYSIPANYEGKIIELQAFMKIKNVKNGYAGLLLRIDGYGDILAFDNMAKKKISGTTDWYRYSIKLDYPEDAEKIIIGGILSGDGEAWFDDFAIFIDGKNILDLEISETKTNKILNNDKINKAANIQIDSALSQIQIKNLKTLGLVWGFLKYYHLSIAKGKYDWDIELLKVFPEVFQAKDEQSRDIILLEWIKSLGEITEFNKSTIKFENALLGPDLDWINNSEFSDNLTEILLEVKNAKMPKTHHYIALHRSVGNPEFKNERKYSTMHYPNTGYRLLALFRYWNIIQYYFPYKDLIDEDWKDVLEEFIPKVVNAKNDVEYALNILELIGRVHDTHANIWGWSPLLNHFGLRYPNVKLSFIEEKAVVVDFFDDSSLMATGLKIGDIIVSVNDKLVEEIVNERLKFTPASNYTTKLRDIANNLLRTTDTLINVKFIRDNNPEELTLKTYSSTEINISKYQRNDTCFRLINKDIAYIDNELLQNKYLPELWKKIRKTKGLILDLRNYPSDFPLYGLSSYLMPNNIPFVKFSEGSIENPGLFTYSGTSSVGRNNKKYYKGKIVIIINEITQSSSEYHAMAYRVHPNAVVIGSTTAGADGNVSEFYLPGGLRTMISGIGIYYPDGTGTQRVGIVPDIEIKPTINGIKEGRDELLEKAISLIEEK